MADNTRKERLLDKIVAAETEEELRLIKAKLTALDEHAPEKATGTGQG